MNYQTSAFKLGLSYATLAAIVILAAALKPTAPRDAAAGQAAAGPSLAAINAEAGLPAYMPAQPPALAVTTQAAAATTAGDDTDTQPPVGAPPKPSDETTMAGTTATPATAGDRTLPLRAVPDRQQHHWQVNVAALASRDEALELVARISAGGFDAATTPVSVNEQRFWRVYLQGFASYAAAQSHAGRLREQLGLQDFWISRAS